MKRLMIPGSLLIILAAGVLFAQENPEKLFELSLEELQNVTVVSAGKQTEIILDVPSSVVLITRREIELMGYRKIENILEDVTGFYIVDDYDGYGQKYGVRGYLDEMPNRKLLILVDGSPVQMSYPSAHPITMWAVPVSAIDRIEIIKGPMSVVYGSGAFYGIVNIITGKDAGTSYAAASAGTSEYYDLSLRYARQYDENLSFILNAGYQQSRGPDVPMSELKTGEYPPQWGVGPDEKTGDKLSRTISYMALSTSYKNLDAHLKYSHSINQGMFLFPPSDGSRTSHMQMFNFSAGYRFDITKKLSGRIKTDYLSLVDDSNEQFFTDTFYGFQIVNSEFTDHELNLYYKIDESKQITFGLFNRTYLVIDKIFDLPSFLNPSFENNHEMLDNPYINSSLFAQTDLSFGRYFRFTGGIRFEYLSPFDYFKEQTYLSETTDIEGRTIYQEIYSKTEGRYDRQELDFLPRAALIFTPADNHVLKLMYGKAIALPSFFHIIKNLGNPDAESLEPEYLQTIEILYQWGVNPDLNISLSLYRNMLSNLISRIIRINPDGSDYRTWNANAGEMKTNGLELSFSGKIFKKLRYQVSGSYQISSDLRTNFEDVDIAFSPPFTGHLKIIYQPSERMAFSIKSRFVDKMAAYFDEAPLDPAAGIFAPAGRIGPDSPSYYVFDINMRFDELFMNNTFINLHITNLLNNKVRYPAFVNNTWMDRGSVGEERNIVLTAGYSL